MIPILILFLCVLNYCIYTSINERRSSFSYIAFKSFYLFLPSQTHYIGVLQDPHCAVLSQCAFVHVSTVLVLIYDDLSM